MILHNYNKIIGQRQIQTTTNIGIIIRFIIEIEMSRASDSNVLIRICRPSAISEGESLEQRSQISNGKSMIDATHVDQILASNDYMEQSDNAVDDRLAIESAKKATQKMEIAYKRLNEKYRKILSILNKCIDLQNAQIDKKALLYIDYMPTMQRPNDKLKISAIKKAENEEEIQKLQKEVTQLESQINGIKEQHKEKINQHQKLLSKKMDEKDKLWKIYQNYCNPKIKIDHPNNHNLYWKPTLIKQDRQSQQNQEFVSPTLTSFTKNAINSHKILTKKNIQPRVFSDKKKTLLFKTFDQNCQTPAQNKIDKTKKMKYQQIKLQINNQEEFLEKMLRQEGHRLKNSTINHIKNRKNSLRVNEQLISQCLKTDYDRSAYLNGMKQEKTFERFQKQFRQKQMATQTITTIRDF